MSALTDLKVFKTPAHPCSYLEDEEATTIFIAPNSELTEIHYQELTDMGFRRSGEHIYRPLCETCSSCISVRIPVEHFIPKRNQRRILNKSKTLSFEIHNDIEQLNSEDYFSLYKTYIKNRHRDGDMYPPSEQQYQDFLLAKAMKNNCTGFLTIKDHKQLLAVCVFDQLENGLSAIYTFFDPHYKTQSLGKLAILKLIEHCQELSKGWLYLGYWIKDCPKMEYKINFRPIELLIKNQWRRLS